MDSSAESSDSHEELQSSENESDTNEDNEERANIQAELRSLSFAELLEMKNELGSKVYKEAVFGIEDSKKRPKHTSKTVLKRENKNRPREVSAKRQVPLLKIDKTEKKAKDRPCDPRFDNKCGDFDREKFKRDYEFLNEIKSEETATLKKQLKELNDEPEQKKKVKMILQRRQNQDLEEKKLQQRRKRKGEINTKVNEAIQHDKKPFFISKGEQKAKELVDQFLELKKSGRLNKHLEKRRKKNVVRDRKKYKFD